MFLLGAGVVMLIVCNVLGQVDESRLPPKLPDNYKDVFVAGQSGKPTLGQLSLLNTFTLYVFKRVCNYELGSILTNTDLLYFFAKFAKILLVTEKIGYLIQAKFVVPTKLAPSLLLYNVRCMLANCNKLLIILNLILHKICLH